MNAPISTQAMIDTLVRSTGASEPFAAISFKVRELIERYRGAFGEPTMPLDVDVLASFLGIGMSDEAPAHSKDAELVPSGNGRVSIRVNRDRPETRKRFSVGHEICHTFFPNYQTREWCRGNGRLRSRDNPDDLVEILCDAGSAELLLPEPWFTNDAARVTTAAGLVDLADKYLVSREAMLRRFAQVHSGCVAAVFLSWKLKPTQKKRFASEQHSLLHTDPAQEALRAKKLRIDYSIASRGFAGAGYYLPADKSVDNDGPLYEAAWIGRPCEGECVLNLGSMKGRYRVLAVPIWTDDQGMGPDGQNAVGAIIEPVQIVSARRELRTAAIHLV